MQLDIFSLVPDCSSRELPKATAPIDPKVEAALNFLLELKALAVPELIEGCTMRSRTAFKDKTAKLLRFEQVCNVKFAVVEVHLYGSLIEYSCSIDSLKVVE